VVTGGGELPPIEPNPLFDSIWTFENNFETSPKKLKARRQLLPTRARNNGTWDRRRIVNNMR